MSPALARFNRACSCSATDGLAAVDVFEHTITPPRTRFRRTMETAAQKHGGHEPVDVAAELFDQAVGSYGAFLKMLPGLPPLFLLFTALVIDCRRQLAGQSPAEVQAADAALGADRTRVVLAAVPAFPTHFVLPLRLFTVGATVTVRDRGAQSARRRVCLQLVRRS